MAPSIKRGKIKAQVFRDVVSVLVSFAVKTRETLGFIRISAVSITSAGNGVAGAPVEIDCLKLNDRLQLISNPSWIKPSCSR
ncbi:hypothetical protein R6Q59_026653 [Mikania micrantha]